MYLSTLILFYVVSLMSVGDLISQSIIEKKDFTQVNYYRVIKFGSIGFILVSRNNNM